MDYYSFFESVETWCRYNPLATAAIGTVVLVMFVYFMSKLGGPEACEPEKDHSEPEKDHSEPEKDHSEPEPEFNILDGRIVPELSPSDNLTSLVAKVLDANANPSVEEIVKLVDAAGFNWSMPAQYKQDRVRAILLHKMFDRIG